MVNASIIDTHMKMKNQLWMYVDIYLYLHEKDPTNNLSPNRKKSPFDKHKHILSCFKVGRPLFQHSLLASPTTNDPNSWKNKSTVMTSIFPTKIYETHIGEIFERICASSIIAINHSLRRAIQSSHQHTTLSIALWTWPSSLWIFRETAVRWFQDITLSIGIVLRAWSLSCSDVWK
jgi:hypothetical protein